jgi:hypothetical protein
MAVAEIGFKWFSCSSKYQQHNIYNITLLTSMWLIEVDIWDMAIITFLGLDPPQNCFYAY